MNLSRLIFLICVLAFVGCSRTEGRPYTDHTQDPDAFAASVHYTVDIAVAEARTSAEPVDAISTIVLILEDLPRRPTGDHRSIYEELFALASEIHEECEAVDGRPANLNQRLDALVALAAQLPGDAATPPSGPRPQ